MERMSSATAFFKLLGTLDKIKMKSPANKGVKGSNLLLAYLY